MGGFQLANAKVHAPGLLQATAEGRPRVRGALCLRPLALAAESRRGGAVISKSPRVCVVCVYIYDIYIKSAGTRQHRGAPSVSI